MPERVQHDSLRSKKKVHKFFFYRTALSIDLSIDCVLIPAGSTGFFYIIQLKRLYTERTEVCGQLQNRKTRKQFLNNLSLGHSFRNLVCV
jgi:hypothetical protein